MLGEGTLFVVFHGIYKDGESGCTIHLRVGGQSRFCYPIPVPIQHRTLAFLKTMLSKTTQAFLIDGSGTNCSLLETNPSHPTTLDKPSNGYDNLLAQTFAGTLRSSFGSQYLTLILTALIVVRLHQRKVLKRRSWINALPGPRTFPLVGGLLYFSRDLRRTFPILLKWSQKYGPIYRSEGLFNEPFVFLENAHHVQAILSSNNLELVTKPEIPYNNLFGEFLRNGLLISKGEYWKSHRRLLSRAFNYSSFHGYTKIFNRHSKRVVKELEKLFSDENGKEPKQISELIHCCSLQIICESVLGLDLRDSKDGNVFNEMFQKYKIISSKRASYFLLMIDFFWKLHPISREYKKIIDVLNGITKKIIESRTKLKDGLVEKHGHKDSDSSTSDSIGSRIRRNMIDEMLASDMTPEEILIEANTVIVAGFESTSLTIHFMLFLLALNPTHQEACQEEIDEVFNDPVQCQDDNLSMDALTKMKYLERCCLETLRLFPVIFLFQRRPEVPVKLDGDKIIPAGVNVIIPTYTLHRKPEYFPEPHKFDPDRFLPENSQKRHPYSFIPFSSGIRNCIGYKFAMLEIKAVAAHILRRFHVSTVDKMDDVPILPSIVMTPMRDYKFILKRRT